MKNFYLAFLCLVTIMLGSCNKRGQSFEVKDGKFLLDGKSVQLICGEMHYPRIPQEYWRDRLKRARAMGLNTVSAYVFWNFHERQPGEFDFEGQADLAHFIKIAQEEGLWVLLRPGPYVCAEWDFGGYPYWLQKDTSMVWRSDDPAFLAACERYIDRLGKELASQTVTNGGNIIMVQVENEYGSYSNDKVYLGKLRDMIINAGFNVPLITCDGAGQMGAGFVENVLPTVNGAVGDDIFRTVDKYHPGGPYFVAEFYPAWFDVWGTPHSLRDYKRPTEQLDWMIKNNVSVSIYMFHGGTNFWYTNGANTSYGYAPQPTSYDYDAPLGEYGNAYPKYYAFREVLQKYLPEGETLPEVPAENPTISFPEITLTTSAPLAASFGEQVTSENVLTMEDVNQDFGYIHYQTTINEPIKGKLLVKDVRDYAVVLVNGKQIGSLDRRHRQNRIDIDVTEVPATLEIVVENVGRVNYGSGLLENKKGITEGVYINGKALSNWTISPMPLYKAKVSDYKWEATDRTGAPAFFKGTFTVNEVGDCFVDMSGWGKGSVWVNGKSLGKFWNIGPQQTLYLPAPWMKKGENEIVVFEMEDTGCRVLKGLNTPILNQLGKDKNVRERAERDYSKAPILDKGDVILSAKMEQKNGWQEFTFQNNATLRHLCLEVLSSYDNKHTALSEIELIDNNGKLLPKDSWQVVFTNTEEPGEGFADQLIDGDQGSYWHSKWQGKTLGFPHRLIVDLGEIQTIKGFRVRQRNASMAGCVNEFKLYGRPQFFLFKQ
ncbi:MAG: beta-galactosidase [Marinifilaceae bacterium]